MVTIFNKAKRQTISAFCQKSVGDWEGVCDNIKK